MAIIKVFSSKGSLINILNYVTNPAKTDDTLISGKDCVPVSSYDEMMSVKNLFNKTTGNTYFHIIQAFSVDDDLSYQKAHKIGLDLANYFKDYQVVIATHKDKAHIHNHLVVNSVSFQDGKKLHMIKKDLEYLKEYSNKLCAEENLSIINTKKSRVKDISKNELAVAQKGESWKFRLMNDIDHCISISNSKEEFIKNMNALNYQVLWSDTRKYITYTTPNGKKCRDKSLHDIKYLKESMEDEFRRIKSKKSSLTRQSSDSICGQNGVLFNATRNDERTTRIGSFDKRRNDWTKKESDRNTRENTERQYADQQRNLRNSATGSKNSISLHEAKFTRNTKRAKTENFKNPIKDRNNNIFNGSFAFSSFNVSPQINNRSRRKIKGYTTLSKQAMKDYAIRKANASSIDWEEDVEM